MVSPAEDDVTATTRSPAEPTTPRRNRRRRHAVFAAVVLCTVAATLAYGITVSRRSSPVAAQDASLRPADLSSVLATPVVVFRSSERGPTYGEVSVAKLDDLGGPHVVTSLQCDRVDMVATVGLCLAASPGIYTNYKAFTFDAKMQVQHGFNIVGIPSRARLSPDGRLAAVTTFVSGHSYATGGFSTATTLYDVSAGREIGNLESFSVTRDGKELHPTDANFWGVTFDRDDDRLYATLATGGQTYLVVGSVRGRTLRTLTTNVECPSLSPDGTRIAFKKRAQGTLVQWRLTVLDLATMRETPLAETRSVDDQAAWLDQNTVTYGLPRTSDQDSVINDVWRVPADGSGTPAVLVAQAWSPAFVQTGISR